MKQLQSERVFLNMAGKESSQTVRLTLHLQDDVDGAVLKEAVEATRQRYPYHQVRLCTRGDEQGIAHYAFDDNPLPWVVTASRQPSASGLLQRCSHHLLSSQSPQGYRHTIGTPADGWFGYNPIP